MKDDFKNYLDSRYTPGTCNSYISGINHLSTHYGADIFRVRDSEEISRLAAVYGLDGEFRSVGEYGNGGARAAIIQLSYFVRNQSGDNNNEVESNTVFCGKTHPELNTSIVSYDELNSRQKEIYNYQKVSALFADYGYTCIKLSDDWNGADFLAYSFSGDETLRVQLKGRLSIAKKYIGKKIHMCFIYRTKWYLIEHDLLVEIIGKASTFLTSESWQSEGLYHTLSPNQDIVREFEAYLL